MIYNIWDVFVFWWYVILLFCFFLDKFIIVFNVYILKYLILYKNIFVNVVYDKLFFNYGNVYNFYSGIFIVLFVGFYIFIWINLVNFKSIFDVEILINGKWKGLGNCNNESNLGYENCVNIVFLVLKVGDKVNFWMIIVNFLYGEWLSFKGWKV